MFLVYECMGACPGGWGGTPATPQKPFFDPSPKHTLKVASGSHLEPLFGSRRPRVLFRGFRVLFYTELVYRKIVVFFSFFVCECQGGQKHTSIHTLCEQNSVICTFPRYLPRKNTTFFENRPFLKRHGAVSV